MANNGSSGLPEVPTNDPMNSGYRRYGIDGHVMLATILCLVFVTLLVFVLHVFARYLLGHDRREGSLTTLPVVRDDATAAMHGTRDAGLVSSVIAALPTFLYGKGNSHICGDEEAAGPAECAVCLSLMQEGERVRLLPNCKHVFHVGCVDIWLRSHSTCPLCRCNADPGTAADKMKAIEAPARPPPQPEAQGVDAAVVMTVEGMPGTKEAGSTSRQWSGREGQGGRQENLKRD